MNILKEINSEIDNIELGFEIKYDNSLEDFAKLSLNNLEKIDYKKNNNAELNFDKVKVLIDETSLGFVQGSKLDFVEDMIGSYFKISNPNGYLLTSTCH